MLILINIFIAAILNGTLNAARGSGLSKRGGIYEIFSKWYIVAIQGGVLFLATHDWLFSILSIFGFSIHLMIGTGRYMLPFRVIGGKDIIHTETENIIIDGLCRILVGLPNTEKEARTYAALFTSVAGLLAYPIFIIFSYLNDFTIIPLIIGIGCVLYGRICSSMFKSNIKDKWRAVEFIWAVWYTILVMATFYS